MVSSKSIVIILSLVSSLTIASAPSKLSKQTTGCSTCCDTLSPCCCCTCYCCKCWDTCCTALMLLRLGVQDRNNIAHAGSICLAGVATSPAHLNHLRAARTAAQALAGITPTQLATEKAIELARIDAGLAASALSARSSQSTTATGSVSGASLSAASSPSLTSQSAPPAPAMDRGAL